MTAEVDPCEAAFQAQIEALRRHFLGELPERCAMLISAWRDCADAGDETPWQRLRDVAHKLSGSASCYGLVAVGEAARDLDKLLSGRAPCRERAAADDAVKNLVVELDAAIGSA